MGLRACDSEWNGKWKLEEQVIFLSEDGSGGWRHLQ